MSRFADNADIHQFEVGSLRFQRGDGITGRAHFVDGNTIILNTTSKSWKEYGLLPHPKSQAKTKSGQPDPAVGAILVVNTQKLPVESQESIAYLWGRVKQYRKKNHHILNNELPDLDSFLTSLFNELLKITKLYLESTLSKQSNNFKRTSYGSYIIDCVPKVIKDKVANAEYNANERACHKLVSETALSVTPQFADWVDNDDTLESLCAFANIVTGLDSELCKEIYMDIRNTPASNSSKKKEEETEEEETE